MTKTIENLKAAITGESTASATYAAYAAKAAQEGQPLIQKLFEAASKAESVHAANHNKVLEKLGATMEPRYPDPCRNHRGKPESRHCRGNP